MRSRTSESRSNEGKTVFGAVNGQVITRVRVQSDDSQAKQFGGEPFYLMDLLGHTYI